MANESNALNRAKDITNGLYEAHSHLKDTFAFLNEVKVMVDRDKDEAQSAKIRETEQLAVQLREAIAEDYRYWRSQHEDRLPS